MLGDVDTLFENVSVRELSMADSVDELTICR
jgi:hypothetical protein